MSIKIFLDGKFVSRDEAKISIFDHGLLYGDGVFEGIRTYNGRVFRLKEHVARLFDSARAIRLKMPFSQDEMSARIRETVKVNGHTNSYIRAVVTRGVGDLGLDPDKCPNPSVFIISAEIQLYPEKFYQEGLSIVTVPTRRNIPEAINPRIKSLNYLNNILAKIEGKLSGKLEALMLTNDGYVCECTGDNIFALRGKDLLTPPVYLGALKGITRDVVIEIGAAMGLKVREEPFTRYELYTADEVFLTGTAAEVVPVVEIDGRKIGSGAPGPSTRDLIARFRKIAQSEGEPV